MVPLEPAQAPTCPEADDMLYIRFWGAKLTLPGRTDMATVQISKNLSPLYLWSQFSCLSWESTCIRLCIWEKV